MSPSHPQPPAKRELDALVRRAAALLASDAAAAEREARRVLAASPSDPRAGLILASARRRQGDPAAAAALLERLARAFPRAAQTRYELGLARAALGRRDEAIADLGEAVTINPDLAEAWRALGEALFAAGRNEAAEAAFDQHVRASIADPALRAVAEALQAGRTAEAIETCRLRLASSPDDAAAANLLGQALLRAGRLEEAEAVLARAVSRWPRLDPARFNLALVLFQQRREVEALGHAQRLLARDGASVPYRNLLAACLSRTGDEPAAITVYQGLLAEAPGQARLWLNLGQALRAVGRRDEALSALRRAIGLAPDLGEAWWNLASLDPAALTDADIGAIRAALARADLADDDRIHLDRALGVALETRGEDEAAFAAYGRAAARRRRSAPYDATLATAAMARMRAALTPELFAAAGDGGARSDAPIFIVGLPRSGSTLIEQILASHSAVEATAELSEIGLIARSLDHAGAYPDTLARLDAAARTRLGEAYLARTSALRRTRRPRFIDKMPGNFQHIGLIRLILPHARIIDARRHPLGSCVSAFRQHFASGQPFTDDLADLGAYYRDYVGFMAHVDDVLPGAVLRVIYEDLVAAPEHQVRRLLAGLGLPFEDACLRFWETRRAVRTISSEQVRRPIFAEGATHWRRFEPWLGPLKEALGPALEEWR